MCFFELIIWLVVCSVKDNFHRILLDIQMMDEISSKGNNYQGFFLVLTYEMFNSGSSFTRA